MHFSGRAFNVWGVKPLVRVAWYLASSREPDGDQRFQPHDEWDNKAPRFGEV